MKMPITVTKQTSKTFSIEFDLDRWERIAAALGLFTPEFLESLDRAEEDFAAGRFREIKSFRELDD